MTRPLLLTILLAALALPSVLRADDDELRFRVVDVKGVVTSFGDQLGTTYRLKKGHKIDEGDKITTGDRGEVVLSLKGKAFLHLGHNTQIRISRLDIPEFKARCQVNLITGHLFIQLNEKSAPLFYVSAGNVLCRAHGALFEVSRRKETFWVLAYEGSMTAGVKGRTWIANPGEFLKFQDDRFRYKKHTLEDSQKARREEFRTHLEALKGAD